MSKCQKPKKTAVAYVRSKIAKMKKGFIFSIDCLITPDYSRSAIQSAINCLIHEKIIIRTCKGIEPYRVCRRLNILRDYSDEKTKLYPRN